MAHGVLMHLNEPPAATSSLARKVADDDVSSTLSAISKRRVPPRFSPERKRALAAFDATTYVNELGAAARAH